MTRRTLSAHWGPWLRLENGVEVRRKVDEHGELVAEEWRGPPVIDLTGRNDSKLHHGRGRSR